ncbi:EAL domain-containing response regulator [Acidocella sp.]|uniref:EAL domain-containing response regulator n=1 Tax=Acidocella sp. TaxID=50710 RepID=UPI003CFFE175
MQFSKPTILIVDDSPTNRRIYARLSRNLDIEVQVRSFANPKGMIDWLADNSADLIITDYKMPFMTGDKLVAHVRSHDPNIPIIVVTAYDDRTYRVACLEAGATDFLLSPVDHVEFVTRVRNLLKLRAQQQMTAHRAEMLEQRLAANFDPREQSVLDSREALAQVINTVPAMISAADRAGNCIFVNALQAAAVGATPEDLVGRPVEMLFGWERGASSRRLDQLVLETGQAGPTREEDVVTEAGDTRVYLTSKKPLRDGKGDTIAVLTTSVDITERRNAEKRLEHMASHDPLTGLPNRALLRDRIQREFARGRRGDQLFALHFIDLDRFKAINDSQGHARGDKLLRNIADMLNEEVDEEDTVARVGGDEFAILQSNITGPDDASRLAGTIIGRLNDGGLCADALNVGASIGITMAPQDAQDAEELMKTSDQAMYAAKLAGGNMWRFFAAEMGTRSGLAANLERDLRNAIARQEFVLHYQPQFDLRSGAVIGAEALLRWARPSGGLVYPSHFLSLAEETGLILPINEWVIDEVCRQIAIWEQQGFAGLRIGLNLSSVQFRRRSIAQIVASAISKAGIKPQSLDLELTEGILLRDIDDIIPQLKVLRGLGVTLSLDDFGTGYSSLSYMQRFPLDRLKIDRSFIQGLADNKNDLAIVRTIIDLGHILNLRVLAEGVETDAQLSLLKEEGCDEAQGFLLSQALPPDTFLGELAWRQAQASFFCSKRNAR